MKFILNSALAFAVATGVVSPEAEARIHPVIPFQTALGIESARCVAILKIAANLEDEPKQEMITATDRYTMDAFILLKDQATPMFNVIAQQEMAPYEGKASISEAEYNTLAKKVRHCIEAVVPS